MKSLLFLLAFSCSLPAFSQQKSFECRPLFAGSDRLGFFYVAEARKLFKLDSVGNMVRLYEDFENGNLSSVDATNPLKVLLFFSDLQRLVMLDRNLTFISRYDLLQLGFTNITAVCASADGRFWLYDASDFKLKKVDENGQLLRESQPLQVLTGSAVNIHFLTEQNGSVYAVDSTRGVFSFDLFASYKRETALRGLRSLQVAGEQWLFSREGALLQYHPLTLEEKTLIPPTDSSVLQTVWQGGFLLQMKKDGVSVRPLKK